MRLSKQELIENIISKQFLRMHQSDFAIIKFQPNNILLLHKETGKIYQYSECGYSSISAETQILLPELLRPIKYSQGVLYQKEKSTLQNELEVRRRAHTIIPFEEEEIVNTFQPIITCLLRIHDLNIIFGSLSPANIILTEEGELMLRDKKIELNKNGYYFHKNESQLKKEDDWLALCQIILQVATLKKSSRLLSEKQFGGVLEGMIDKFSKGFLFAMWVMVKRIKDKFALILSFLKNEAKSLEDNELNAIYSSLRSQKQRKKAPVVTNENINIYQNIPLNKPISFSVHESPMRKAMATTFGNTLRKISKEDSENKKTPTIELKGRKTDRINKIIEKSNQFVNELMAKKTKEGFTKIAPKPNIANISLFSSDIFRKKTKQAPMIGPSPSKNIRSISRKK